MEIPGALRKRLLRNTKSQLIDEMTSLLGRVTELEQAAAETTPEALAKKEAQLRVAMDNMPGGMFMVDENQVIRVFNQQYKEMYDYDDVTLHEGASLAELVRVRAERGDYGPGDPEELVEQRMRGYIEGMTLRHEEQLPNGRIIELWRKPVEGGGVVAIATDITERKQAEEALAEKETQLREIIENMTEGLVCYDADQRLILCNDMYRDFYGYTEEDVAPGTHFEDLVRLDEKRGAVVDDGTYMQERIAHRAQPHGTHVIQLKDGRWLQMREHTTASGTVSIQTNITERKLAEEELTRKEAQLRVALDNMPSGMLLFDQDLNYVLFNAQYSELCEFPDGLVRDGGSFRDELRYQADRGDFGPGDKDELVERVVATYQTGEAVRYEREISGSGRTIQVYVAPTPEGGYVDIVTDISKEKRAEDELQAAYEIIKDQKERMEEELNVGHDIQMSMIPLTFPPFPDHDEFSVFAALEPAREVGGDFYDYYFIDEERICFCIGDVSGKGVPAALFMAMSRTLIKSRAADDRSTASILTHVNDELSVDNQTCMFVTVFAVILNIRTGELLYTNAGHNPPYIKRKDGTLQCLDQLHGPVVGAVDEMVYAEGRDTMAPGDLLLLFTDGVTEAMDVGDRLFSEDRLEQLLTAMDTDDADEVVNRTVAAVRAFEGEAEQADDITVLALAFHGSPRARQT